VGIRPGWARPPAGGFRRAAGSSATGALQTARGGWPVTDWQKWGAAGWAPFARDIRLATSLVGLNPCAGLGSTGSRGGDHSYWQQRIRR